MKYKKYLLYLQLSLIILFFQCTKNENTESYSYSAPYVKSVIQIDGMLDEDAWKNSKKVALKINKTAEVVTDSSFMTWFKACYDQDNVYIAFECNDSDIWSTFSNRDDHLWENDAVEIFIDTDGHLNTYYEIQVSPKNVLFDAHLEIPTKTDDDEIIAFDIEGIQTAVSIDGTLNMREDVDQKWTVEIAIPIADLNEERASFDSKVWRINFFRMNKDLNRERPDLAWSPTSGNFHLPSKFGVLKFH